MPTIVTAQARDCLGSADICELWEPPRAPQAQIITLLAGVCQSPSSRCCSAGLTTPKAKQATQRPHQISQERLHLAPLGSSPRPVKLARYGPNPARR